MNEVRFFGFLGVQVVLLIISLLSGMLVTVLVS